MKSWLSFMFAITSEVSIGISVLFVCASNLSCYLSCFGDLAIQNHTHTARIPPLMSQRLLPWRQQLAAFLAWVDSRQTLWTFPHQPWYSLWPGRLLCHHLMPHATCVQHGATKVHSGKLHLLPVIGFGHFKLTFISERSPVRGAWPWNSGGSSSPQHIPQAEQRLRHWTTSPWASAPVDKHQARQQYRKRCWIQLLHHLYKTYCFKACTRQSHILSQSSSHLGERTTLDEFFSLTQ